MRITIQGQIPRPAADLNPAALVVVRVQQLKNVVTAVIRNTVVGFGVHRDAAFLEPFEMHPAAADHDAKGIGAVCYLQVGEVEKRRLAWIGPVLDSAGIRCSALRELDASATRFRRRDLVRPATDPDGVSSRRRVGPLLQRGKRASFGAGI